MDFDEQSRRKVDRSIPLNRPGFLESLGGARIHFYLFGAFLQLVGLPLLFGGGWLAALGGSPYYVLAGVACLISGMLIWRRSDVARLVYAGLLLVTAGWSLMEVGLDFYQLLPRMGGPVVIAVLLALPFWKWKLRRPGLYSAPLLWFGLTCSVGILLFSFARQQPDLVAHTIYQRQASPDRGTPDDWTAWSRTVHGTRYSPADQITPVNVSELKPAWVYHTGDWRMTRPETTSSIADEETPLKVGNTLYICTPQSMVAAIDADTGEQRWEFDPDTRRVTPLSVHCRGVSYHHSKTVLAQCTDRILVGTIDERLIALDAQTGRPCADFGENGEVSLKSTTNPDPGDRYPTSPALIIGDTAVIGAYVVDNFALGEPSGVVRAFDVHSGALKWAWDSANPDSAAPLAPGQDYSRGSPNAWAVFSADPELGLVYIPTGNATPDFLNAHRTAAENRYASSIVALNAESGNVRWSFQTTHLDLWDYDVPAQPVLFDFPTPTGRVPALAAPTKRGEIFILDRRTGEPLTRVEERKVTVGNIPGEQYSPTQPYSTGFPSLAPKFLQETDMWGMTPLDQLWCRIKYKSYQYLGDFTPPSTKGTIEYPGNFGAINWGGVTVDEDRDLMFVNSSSLPLLVQLIPQAVVRAAKPSSSMHDGLLPQKGTPYAVKLNWMLSPLGIPCTAPPWGNLTVIDLRTRTVLWQRPLGTTADHAPLGLPIPGVFNIGGSTVTRSGLLFVGATLDAYLRAFDVSSGRELWRGRLPGGGATPITYVSSVTGQQYVVISAGGNEGIKTKTGDSVVGFVLPKSSAP
jgi:quinoprotein glucose dehydrogenase